MKKKPRQAILAMALKPSSVVHPDNLILSSDGQGSLPIFDENNNFAGLQVGTCRSLFPEVRDAVVQEGVALNTALQTITSNPARLYKLRRKGRIAVDFDADFVMLEPQTLSITTVMALGQVMVQDGQPIVTGTFESEAAATG